jgi:hypothetical protein
VELVLGRERDVKIETLGVCGYIGKCKGERNELWHRRWGGFERDMISLRFWSGRLRFFLAGGCGLS